MREGGGWEFTIEGGSEIGFAGITDPSEGRGTVALQKGKGESIPIVIFFKAFAPSPEMLPMGMRMTVRERAGEHNGESRD